MYVTRGTFSQDLKDANTTLGGYLRATFPNLKPIQADYKSRADALVVDSAGSSPTLIGTAVDLIPRLVAEPNELPTSAALLFPFNQDYVFAALDSSRGSVSSTRTNPTVRSRGTAVATLDAENSR